jgi:amino acid adenylation domain-containing protein
MSDRARTTDLECEASVYEDGFAALVELGRGTPLKWREADLVHETFEKIAAQQPDVIAVACDNATITYAALNDWAVSIADELAGIGASGEMRVAVVMEPSIAMVAAVLGILKVGASYVPIHYSELPGRLAAILRDADIGCIVASKLSESRVSSAMAPVLSIDSYLPQSRGADIPETALQNARSASPDDPAYLIYTSGSTGEPKGVVVEHRQLASSTVARRQIYESAATFLLVSPLAFDSSAAGLWGTLTQGGQLVIATMNECQDPSRLLSLIERYRVARLLCVPGLYAVLLDAAERLGKDLLDSLQSVIVAGEPLPDELLARHFRLCPEGAALFNEYGPTEATVWATYRRFDRPAAISIGGPAPGVQLYVLDEDGGLAPRGDAGELCIGGVGVSRGYWGRPDATAHAFVKDPFSDAADARIYRTGDVVRWTAEGDLAFLGRRDGQIKVRGQRVEIGAIEAALREVEGVRDAVVQFDAVHSRLTAFILAPPDFSLTDFRSDLAGCLPRAMIPDEIERVDNFPQTPNGKIDREALRLASVARKDLKLAPIEVRSTESMEAKVAFAWSEVLEQPSLPLDCNFFDLGGNSLQMFKLQDALENHTGIRPTVISLFRHVTIRAQAEMLAENEGAPSAFDLHSATGEFKRRRLYRRSGIDQKSSA